jgi:hypothetical protein
MIKNVVYFLTFVVATAFAATGVVYANGTTSLSAEDIAQQSIQDLRSLQSELKTAIDMEIGQANCTEDMQCKALAIGANPCGGPESYQAYSILNTNIEQLSELAAQYKQVRKTLHAKTGTVGACVVIPEPAVQCKNQQCVTIQKPNVLVF